MTPTPDDKPSDPKPDPKPQDKRYIGYMFTPRRHRRTGPNVLEVEGTVTWTIRRPEQEIAQFMAAWDAKGYKMGLLVLQSQNIESIAYQGFDRSPVELQPDPSAIPDLESTLGTPPGYKWLAFYSTGRRAFTMLEPNVVQFTVGVRISPAQSGPQTVPVASRHLDGTYADSYMPGLWVLPGA
jgi:hypothetical protein